MGLLGFELGVALRAASRTGHSGWYYRLLQQVSLSAGATLTLTTRPNPDFPFTRLVPIVSFGRPTRAELERMADMEGLASQWRRKARMILGRP